MRPGGDPNGEAIPATCGEMRRRVLEFDWELTPLGPMARWSDSLKVAVEIVLASGYPMALRWGADLIMIYNDAYVGLLGDKHPACPRENRRARSGRKSGTGSVRSASRSCAASATAFSPSTIHGRSSALRRCRGSALHRQLQPRPGPNRTAGRRADSSDNNLDDDTFAAGKRCTST